jgi:putative mRNA 3-end processing factor
MGHYNYQIQIILRNVSAGRTRKGSNGGKMNDRNLLELTDSGIYCRIGDFHIDPWRPVRKAVITHAHFDHARPGSKTYLVSEYSKEILKLRLGHEIDVTSSKYGETIHLNGIKLSLHPAGHVLGSSQVRIEHGGQVWVVSGDFKTEKDSTCDAFEQLRCHTFVTESTFGLPVFRWSPQNEIFDNINSWWKSNQSQAITSILFAYALGKSQRIIAGLDPTIGPIFTHGAVENVNQCYRDAGIALPATRYIGLQEDKRAFFGAMVVAPPTADHHGWTKKFSKTSKGLASGWMQIRGMRRRRSVDRGFVLSDHSDWKGLTETIRNTGAESVWVMHGYSTELVRWLREKGLDAIEIETGLGTDIEADE